MTHAVLFLVLLQSFEVASIKPSKPDQTGSGSHERAGQVYLDNYSLKDVILMAYDLKDYAISTPDWTGSAHFDFVAKLPPMSSRAQRRVMLQALLAERFGLKVHRESKEVVGYALVPAKGGLKLAPVEPGGNDMETGTGQLVATKISMEQFGDWLARRVGRPVRDESGAKGVYDIKLTWAPDEAAADGPSIFTAIQEQLGLRLEGRKQTIDMLVVDQMNKMPTEN